MQSVVFDAFALLVWLKGEAGADYVADLLSGVTRGELTGAVCAVSLGEVYYIVARYRDPGKAESILRELLTLDWEVMDASRDLIWSAARLKAQHPISYADAFALACAQARKASLVTPDPELRRGRQGVTILWAE